MSHCPCGNPINYEQCCQPVHLDHHQAQTPEQLMRARYSAHVKGLVDFVVATYHPSCEAEAQREAIADSVNSHWLSLEVLGSEAGHNQEEGFVTFQAYFEQEEQEFCLEERSRFVRENDLWYYIDGEYAEQDEEPQDERLSQPIKSLKVGRNDPCICGSGKKFKKCCG
ncbi:hypothetical protein VII00023_19294 [Vibrio ichthyoenteri ATCC 700023]|uniref:YchJ-like middle NTF2-like domain-containing protein n=1 Tax=Vibrio ichthyoenteri ATCC 700023 TaxID=870968 RepID=F9S389_9VIBR|nr:YchJ family protein [Vibrio ichthyoenteri]EGU38113.1 hypothetical protein VII00023_19294 [Vibrio ichthyoenteri ATCC 700023]